MDLLVGLEFVFVEVELFVQPFEVAELLNELLQTGLVDFQLPLVLGVEPHYPLVVGDDELSDNHLEFYHELVGQLTEVSLETDGLQLENAQIGLEGDILVHELTVIL